MHISIVTTETESTNLKFQTLLQSLPCGQQDYFHYYSKELVHQYSAISKLSYLLHCYRQLLIHNLKDTESTRTSEDHHMDTMDRPVAMFWRENLTGRP